MNIKLNFFIFNNTKGNALRIKTLPGFETGKTHKVFVIEGDKAVKKEVVLGIVGDDYCEILSGLKEGDIVISEETGSIRRKDEIDINN